MGSWGSYRSPFPRPVLRHSLVLCFGIASSRASALPRPVLRHCLVPCFGIASSRAAALPRPVLRHCLVPCFGIASSRASALPRSARRHCLVPRLGIVDPSDLLPLFLLRPGNSQHNGLHAACASRHGTTCGWASQRLPCLTVSTHTLPPPFRPLPPPFRPLPPPFRPLPPPFRPLPPPFRPLPPPFRPLPPPFRPLPPPFRPLPPPFRPLPPPFRPLPPPFRPLPPPFRPLPPPFRPLPPPFRPLPPPFRPLPLPSALFPSPLPQRFTEWEYLWVGLAAALPCVLVPPFMLCAADKGRPWHEQHWVKANVWIAIFSFVGNYFWTHYFYTLLGASYTFPSWRLNDVSSVLSLLALLLFLLRVSKGLYSIAIFSFVGNCFWTHYFYTLLGASYTFPSWRLNDSHPIHSRLKSPTFTRTQVPFALYLLTHACFCFYHVISTITSPSAIFLPSLKPSVNLKSRLKSHIEWALNEWALFPSVIVLPLHPPSHQFEYYTFVDKAPVYRVGSCWFEYYTFVDKAAMYRVGTLFYALYFVVSFPFFFRIDEDTSDSWPLSRVAVDSLGASMLVTILLDIWRLVIGPITQLPQTNTCASGLPWMG
ncbi:unnamed protein product [Closterium sp. NIES-65]|nr:unnamed protein product [Closterium sp. NIES-65]